MKVLTIGDTHFPAVHPGYLRFCEDLAERYSCNRFVHIGDVVDFHAISRFGKLPEADGATYELDAAHKDILRWYGQFPNMVVTEGNHDQRSYRAGAESGLPQRFLKGYNELFDTPKWKWVKDVVIDGVYYFHGTGVSGQHPAFNTMQKMLMSTVMGHVHTAGGIKWRANPEKRIFGMDVGCGVDDKHLSFHYAENLKIRSILSAGVVIDGVPSHHIMQAGDGERYHRSRFSKCKH